MKSNCLSRTLIEDTRNKVGKHQNIYSYCQIIGIPIIRRKLDFGDYILDGNDNLIVDTKSSLLEVAMDLSGKGEIRRFYRQCYRSFQSHARLVFLVETDPIYKKLEDVKYWVNPNYSRARYCMSGIQLYRAMRKAEIVFKVEFILTDHKSMGKKLIDILTGAE